MSIRIPALLVCAAVLLAPVRAAAGGAGDITSTDPSLTAVPESVAIEDAYEKKLVLPLGPLFIERGPTVDRSIFFPLLFHQKKKGSSPSTFLGIAPIYWYYRGAEDGGTRADVVFPFWWYFAKGDRQSAVVPPFYYEKWQGDGAFRTGLAPLFFAQRTPKLDYTVVPPLVWHFETPKHKFVLVPPFFYNRKGTDVDMGVPPLFFNGWNDKKGHFVLFPLVWHFENYVRERSDTVVGPVWFGRRGDSWSFFLAPLIFFRGGKKGPGLDIFPLVHWDTLDGGSRVVTPLAWYWANEKAKVKGGGGLLYHRYRRDDFLFQTFAPLYFGWQHDNMMEKSHLIVPVGYFNSSPIERNMTILGLFWDFHRYDEHRTTVFLPLFAHSKDLYRENHTTWVFPTFQYTRKEKEWQFNMHPLAYFKGGASKTHQVIFPLWWRFTTPKKIHQVAFPLWWDFQNLGKQTRGTSFFPLFWRFEKTGGDHTVVLNSYHFKSSDDKKTYRYVFFPLFGFGKDEDKQEKYWKVLLGLVGWRSNKFKDTLYLLWLPLKVKDHAPTPEPGPEAG
ncbi:MAG: hypothetical protein JRG91_02335 [Deltaproteobacteria bacterium]|nr:hypothetical protein [Deltaproteobacteria bacterium]